VNIDPAPSLRLWAVTVDLAGRQWRIPPLGAGVWLGAIGGTYSQIVPGLLELGGDEQDALLDLMLAGQLRAEECHAAARDAIATVTGMKWWAAARLTSYLMQEWGTLGGEVLRRVDLERHSVGAVLTVVYRTLLENCKGEPERQKLDFELTKVPPGVDVEEMIDRQAASDAFMALAAIDGD